MPVPAFLTRSPYLRLMRLHQPIGIWLVYWPCVWALALAALAQYQHTGALPLGHLAGYLALFFFGAVAMRSAGCIVNDMADRRFDAHVTRTRTRPLASGELSLRQGFLALALACFAGLAVLLVLLLTLPVHVAVATMAQVALPVVGLIVAYPFMKRITWWPQAFLGLTFNWGVLIGWVSLRGQLEWPALWLYLACLCWTLGYDTIYGHQDKADDIRIGVKSTALRLQGYGKAGIGLFYLGMAVFYALATLPLTGGLPDWAGLGLIGLHSLWYLRRLDLDDPASCLHTFRRNAWLGMGLGVWLLALLGFSVPFG